MWKLLERLATTTSVFRLPELRKLLEPGGFSIKAAPNPQQSQSFLSRGADNISPLRLLTLRHFSSPPASDCFFLLCFATSLLARLSSLVAGPSSLVSLISRLSSSSLVLILVTGPSGRHSSLVPVFSSPAPVTTTPSSPAFWIVFLVSALAMASSSSDRMAQLEASNAALRKLLAEQHQELVDAQLEIARLKAEVERLRTRPPAAAASSSGQSSSRSRAPDARVVVQGMRLLSVDVAADPQPSASAAAQQERPSGPPINNKRSRLDDRLDDIAPILDQRASSGQRRGAHLPPVPAASLTEIDISGDTSIPIRINGRPVCIVKPQPRPATPESSSPEQPAGSPDLNDFDLEEDDEDDDEQQDGSDQEEDDDEEDENKSRSCRNKRVTPETK